MTNKEFESLYRKAFGPDKVEIRELGKEHVEITEYWFAGNATNPCVKWEEGIMAPSGTGGISGAPMPGTATGMRLMPLAGQVKAEKKMEEKLALLARRIDFLDKVIETRWKVFSELLRAFGGHRHDLKHRQEVLTPYQRGPGID